jgi:ATP-binding cassette subfamily C (CFTR/MRP) protein 1
MEHLSGTVKFGGSVGYASQQAWIQNLSVKENITSFASGRDFNEAEYWAAVKAAALPADLGNF